jgi:hypothetical protein
MNEPVNEPALRKRRRNEGKDRYLLIPPPPLAAGGAVSRSLASTNTRSVIRRHRNSIADAPLPPSDSFPLPRNR